MAQNTQCKFEKCDKVPIAKGWCKTHYLRVTKTGSPWRHCMDCKSKLPEDAGRSKRCGRCSNANRCTVDGCERKPAGNGLCKYHWKKNKLYGDPLGKSSYKPTKSTCTIAGCERPYHSNGYCNYHGYRAEKYGTPLAQGPGKHAGRNRMEVPSYAGMHKRIFYDKGAASKHQCVDCRRPAKEWSYKGGAPNEYWELTRGCNLAYTTDQSYYEPRCVKCHRRKDLEIIQDNA